MYSFWNENLCSTTFYNWPHLIKVPSQICSCGCSPQICDNPKINVITSVQVFSAVCQALGTDACMVKCQASPLFWPGMQTFAPILQKLRMDAQCHNSDSCQIYSTVKFILKILKCLDFLLIIFMVHRSFNILLQKHQWLKLQITVQPLPIWCPSNVGRVANDHTDVHDGNFSPTLLEGTRMRSVTLRANRAL